MHWMQECPTRWALESSILLGALSTLSTICTGTLLVLMLHTQSHVFLLQVIVH